MRTLGCGRRAGDFDRNERTQVVQAPHDEESGITARCGIDGNGCRYRQILLLLRFQSDLRRREPEKRARNPAAPAAEQVGRRGHQPHSLALAIAQCHRDSGPLARPDSRAWFHCDQRLCVAGRQLIRRGTLGCPALQLWPEHREVVHELMHLAQHGVARARVIHGAAASGEHASRHLFVEDGRRLRHDRRRRFADRGACAVDSVRLRRAALRRHRQQRQRPHRFRTRERDQPPKKRTCLVESRADVWHAVYARCCR